MAAKPETAFIGSVHKHLPGSIHKEKMNNPYRGGTADVWYSARNGLDLWVEYKFVKVLRKKGVIVPDLSDLQFLWLSNRRNDGRNVAVIVGHPDGGVILPPILWKPGMEADAFRAASMTRPELAETLMRFLMSAHDTSANDLFNGPVSHGHLSDTRDISVDRVSNQAIR